MQIKPIEKDEHYTGKHSDSQQKGCIWKLMQPLEQLLKQLFFT